MMTLRAFFGSPEKIIFDYAFYLINDFFLFKTNFFRLK